MPTPNNGGWNVVSTTPATSTTPDDGWNVVSTQPAQQFGSQDADQILKQQAGFDPNAPLPSATSRAISGAWQGVKDAASGLFNTAGTLLSPSNMAAAVVNAGADTAGALADAKRANQIGDVSRRNLDYLRAIPLIGSTGRALGGSMAAGDYSGAIARDVAANATGAVLPKLAVGALGTALKTGGKVAQFAAATPESQASGIARAWTHGDSPAETLNKALQPSAGNTDFAGDVSTALPSVSKNFVEGSGVAGIRDAANAAQDQSTAQYGNWLDPNKNAPVDMAPVEAAQNNSIPAVANLENPGLQAKIAEIAARYNTNAPTTVTTTSPILDEFGKPVTTTTTTPGTPTTLGDADTLRIGNNQKLQGFWDASQGNKYAARANPEVARTESAGNALRDVVYGKLSEKTGVPVDQIRANQDLFGAAKNVGDTAATQALKMGKKLPESPVDLKTGIAVASGHPVAAAAAKGLDLFYKAGRNPDALANAAIDRFQSPDAVTFQPRNSIPAKAVAATGRVRGTTRKRE